MNKMTVVDQKPRAPAKVPAPAAEPQTVAQVLDMGAFDIRAALASGQIIHTCESLNHAESKMQVIASFVVCPQELGEELEKQLTAVIDDFFERCGIVGAADEQMAIQ